MSNQQQPMYLNGVDIGPGLAGHTHIDQPRQYKGKGDFAFDMQIIVTPEVGAALNQRAYEAFQAWFAQEEFQSPFFRWPAKLINKGTWPTCDETLLEKFPDHYVISMRRKADKGPVSKIDAEGNNIAMPGKFKPGNLVIAGADFATYRESDKNFGIGVYLGQVAWLGEGYPLSLGGGSTSISADALAAARAATASAPAPAGGAPAQPGTATPGGFVPGQPTAAPQAPTAGFVPGQPTAAPQAPTAGFVPGQPTAAPQAPAQTQAPSGPPGFTPAGTAPQAPARGPGGFSF